jgi:hypothetical protein
LRQGDIRQARVTFEIGLQQFQKEDSVSGLVYIIEGLASLLVNQGYPKRAVHLFAWADAMREKPGDHRLSIEQADVERDLAIIHSKLNDPEFAKFSTEGRAMTLAQAITLALEPADEM